MTIRKWNLLALVAVVGFVGRAWAFCPDDKTHEHGAQTASAPAAATPCAHAASEAGTKSGSGCCKNKGAAALASDKSGGCPFAKQAGGSSPADTVLASLPSMKYRVGDETMCCAKTAEAAAKNGTAVKYVVGDTAFESKGEATVALAKLLEAEIPNLVSVQYSIGGKTSHCSHEAQELAKLGNTQVAYKVAGLESTDKTKAEKAAQLAAEAMASVKLSYKVGDASFCCDKMAGMKAKETGKSITFVVGTEETPCEQTAKLMVAQAKIRAAVEAAANALKS